jgi:hypothetical protein
VVEPSAVELISSLGPTGIVVVAVVWAVSRLDSARATEREASKAVLDAHLSQLKEIADVNKASADALRSAIAALHEVVGEIRGSNLGGSR